MSSALASFCCGQRYVWRETKGGGGGGRWEVVDGDVIDQVEWRWWTMLVL